MDGIIEADQYVLIRLPSSTLRLIKLSQNATVNLGKFGSFKADEIIGLPFGYTYEIQDGGNGTVDHHDEGTDKRQDEIIGTNELTVDDPTVQRLSMQEIEQLKKTASANEIIARVIESHAGFNQKTIFSKQKYTRRKQQKFLKRFTPCQVGSSEIIEYFQYKQHSRILELTLESLGLIMSLANVRPGGNYIVLDDTGGLITGAMMERMGLSGKKTTNDDDDDNHGSILFVHENEHANFDTLKFMNFSDQVINHTVKTINLLQLFHPQEEEPVKILSDDVISNMKPARRGQYYRRLHRHAELSAIFQNLTSGFYDGLILATTLDLSSSLLDKLLTGLAGSRQVVIYNPAKEPLVNYSHALMRDLRVLAPTILESRVRKYQVYPGRTHPVMTMQSGGGYVLWGTRVLPSSDVRAGGKKRRKPNQ
ncbi:Gcd10p family-domain-containing protein [Lipomyces japonicus]|uniref:Gcd10p family-domain-containing protein n=1 Tax=Lipomyces japonicus TaxID=56871 RepID=UPI0034CDC391